MTREHTGITRVFRTCTVQDLAMVAPVIPLAEAILSRPELLLKHRAERIKEEAPKPKTKRAFVCGHQVGIRTCSNNKCRVRLPVEQMIQRGHKYFVCPACDKAMRANRTSR